MGSLLSYAGTAAYLHFCLFCGRRNSMGEVSRNATVAQYSSVDALHFAVLRIGCQVKSLILPKDGGAD
jgi:hypothetical protein